MFGKATETRYEVENMNEIESLMIKKRELEQLIRDNQEYYSGGLHGHLSSYAAHPADLAAHLQVLNIELEKINSALSQYKRGSNNNSDFSSTELH